MRQRVQRHVRKGHEKSPHFRNVASWGSTKEVVEREGISERATAGGLGCGRTPPRGPVRHPSPSVEGGRGGDTIFAGVEMKKVKPTYSDNEEQTGYSI